MISDYEAPLLFSPLTVGECLLRYGTACNVQARSVDDDARWERASRDRDALHWRVYMALKHGSH